MVCSPFLFWLLASDDNIISIRWGPHFSHDTLLLLPIPCHLGLPLPPPALSLSGIHLVKSISLCLAMWLDLQIHHQLPQGHWWQMKGANCAKQSHQIDYNFPTFSGAIEFGYLCLVISSRGLRWLLYFVHDGDDKKSYSMRAKTLTCWHSILPSCHVQCTLIPYPLQLYWCTHHGCKCIWVHPAWNKQLLIGQIWCTTCECIFSPLPLHHTWCKLHSFGHSCWCTARGHIDIASPVHYTWYWYKLLSSR